MHIQVHNILLINNEIRHCYSHEVQVQFVVCFIKWMVYGCDTYKKKGI